jgi:hypothetical protein
MLEKYRNLARDAQLSGDRVMTEYYLQFADHYFRVLSDTRARQEEQRARYDDRDDRDTDNGGDGDDRGNDSGDDAADDGDNFDSHYDAIDQIGRAPRNREGRRDNRDGREGREQRQPRQRDDARGDTRSEGQRGDAPRRERSDNGDRGQQNDSRRRERPAREPRQYVERDDRDSDQPASIDIAVLPPAIGIEPVATSVVAATSEEEAPAPKRRGRPRKAAVETDDAVA